MDDDVVERLRDLEHVVELSRGTANLVMLSGSVFSDAASEIERLRGMICRYVSTREAYIVHGGVDRNEERIKALKELFAESERVDGVRRG